MRRILPLFSLMVLFAFLSCEDAPVNDIPPPPPEVTVDSPWQFSATIDGTTFTAKDSTLNYFGTYSTSGFVAPVPDTSALIYQSSLSNDTINTNSLHITKGTLRFASGMIPPDTIFQEFLKPASYSYSVGAVDGIMIEWFDSNGDRWSTDDGSAIQTGSTFVISAIKTSYINAYFDVRIKATFNCKLYNSAGQSKTLTSGLYIGSFEAI